MYVRYTIANTLSPMEVNLDANLFLNSVFSGTWTKKKFFFLFCQTLLFQITKQSQSVPISCSNQKGIRNRSSSRGKRPNFSVSKVYIKFAMYKASIFPAFLNYILQIINFLGSSEYFFQDLFCLCCLSRWKLQVNDWHSEFQHLLSSIIQSCYQN